MANQHTQIDNSLHDIIEAEIFNLKIPNVDAVLKMHRKIRKADMKGEIGRINRIFHSSLKPEYNYRLKISPMQLKLLDKANIYTWIAYSIYDEVFDENDIISIPSANALVRVAYSIYIQAGVPTTLINDMFSIVDNANHTELSLRSKKQHAPKDFEQLLFGKSIAHCLGQIWILSSLQIANKDVLSEGFRNYCSARQLSDDVFDWRDDIMRGHYTYATTVIVKSIPKNVPQFKNFDFTQLTNISFWLTGLEYLCGRIISYSDACIAELNNYLKPGSIYINRFILPLKNNAEESIANHLLDKNSVF